MAAGRIQKNPAKGVPDSGGPELESFLRTQRVGQKRHLSGLARAVDALQGD